MFNDLESHWEFIENNINWRNFLVLVKVLKYCEEATKPTINLIICLENGANF